MDDNMDICYIFYMYSSFSFLGFIYYKSYLVETKGLSGLEIDQKFGGKITDEMVDDDYLLKTIME